MRSTARDFLPARSWSSWASRSSRAASAFWSPSAIDSSLAPRERNAPRTLPATLLTRSIGALVMASTVDTVEETVSVTSLTSSRI